MGQCRNYRSLTPMRPPPPKSSIAPENSPKLLKWLEDSVPLIGGQAFCFPPLNESGGKVVGLIEVRLIQKKYHIQASIAKKVCTPNSMRMCSSPIIFAVVGWLEEPDTPYRRCARNHRRSFSPRVRQVWRILLNGGCPSDSANKQTETSRNIPWLS